jgi:hypothetical protein
MADQDLCLSQAGSPRQRVPFKDKWKRGSPEVVLPADYRGILPESEELNPSNDRTEYSTGGRGRFQLTTADSQMLVFDGVTDVNIG